MAIVSISRIQIRRGRKNTGTGFPQLASGEFGWAVDTQELYIGNGSVSEGAPYVGNTKLLSEHDDLFALADDYTYRQGSNIQTGPSVNLPIRRTLQDRLDDIVSIRSFGATGDGSNQTVALQRAIDQIFLNTDKNNPRSRKVLYLEAGNYTIDDTIYLPPFTILKGAGKQKTIITKTTVGPIFKTINSLSTPGNYANDTTVDNATTTLNQARNLEIEGLSLILNQSTGPGILLQNCANSIFSNILIQGSFSNGDSSYNINDVGISLTIAGSLGSAGTKNNVFSNVTVQNFSYGVRSKHDIQNNIWSNCVIKNCGYGIEFGQLTNLVVSGEVTGPIANTIRDSYFEDIDRHGIWISNGKYNLSSDNKFVLVGNDGGNEGVATYSVLNFEQVSNNSKNDYFGRSQELSYNQTYFANPYIPEISGEIITDISYTNKVTLTQFTQPVVIFRLPVESKKSFRLEYLYVSNTTDAMRQGELSIVVNPDQTIDPLGQVHLVDDYDFVGNAILEEFLSFSCELKSYNLTGSLDTLEISVLNFTSDGSTSDAAELYWTVHTKIG